MDLDEMLRVDRRWDMDELINFPDHSPDAGTYCFLRYRVGCGTLQPCLGCHRAALLREFYVGKIPRIRIGSLPLERAVVLKWFYSLSRRKTFVGGKCALPSDLLV